MNWRPVNVDDQRRSLRTAVGQKGSNLTRLENEIYNYKQEKA